MVDTWILFEINKITNSDFKNQCKLSELQLQGFSTVHKFMNFVLNWLQMTNKVASILGFSFRLEFRVFFFHVCVSYVAIYIFLFYSCYYIFQLPASHSETFVQFSHL